MDAVADMAYYLAEWYLPEMTAESVDDVVAKLDAAAVIVSSEGTPVQLVVTLAVPTDEVLYGVFGATLTRHRVEDMPPGRRATPAAIWRYRRADSATARLRGCRSPRRLIHHRPSNYDLAARGAS